MRKVVNAPLSFISVLFISLIIASAPAADILVKNGDFALGTDAKGWVGHAVDFLLEANTQTNREARKIIRVDKALDVEEDVAVLTFETDSPPCRTVRRRQLADYSDALRRVDRET